MADRLTNITRLKLGLSKAASGMNTVPDWIENSPVGTTQIGSPYYDSVRFSLIEDWRTVENGDRRVTDEFINTTISIAGTATIPKTKVNGRIGEVKQFVNQNDWNITFNINIFSPFAGPGGPIPEGTQYLQVGRQLGMQKYRGDYYPNDTMQNIVNFLDEFYNNDEWTKVKVISGYLNNNFGIGYIIPYSIRTKQNHSTTNSYNLTIQAYSETEDGTDEITQEIIPNV